MPSLAPLARFLTFFMLYLIEWLLWTFCLSGAKVFEVKRGMKGLEDAYHLRSELYNYGKHSFVSIPSSSGSSLSSGSVKVQRDETEFCS